MEEDDQSKSGLKRTSSLLTGSALVHKNITERIENLKKKSKSKSSLFENTVQEKSLLADHASKKQKYQDIVKSVRSHSQPKLHNQSLPGDLNNPQGIDPNNKKLLFSTKTRKGFCPTALDKPNQDAYFAKVNFMGRNNYHVFCVCDGHGVNGHLVSQFVVKSLQMHLSKKILAWEAANLGPNSNRQLPLEEIIFAAVDHCVKDLHATGVDIMFSGTTCNCCIIKDDLLYVTNIGDSRAILGFEENGKTISKALSYDHKPEFEAEKNRIIKNNGRIGKILTSNGNYVGPQRVWLKDEDIPGLAMTRSIGDLVAESVGVTWKPGNLELSKKSRYTGCA